MLNPENRLTAEDITKYYQLLKHKENGFSSTLKCGIELKIIGIYTVGLNLNLDFN